MKISDKISVVVTGGASGLGEATARRLAAGGARVAIFDMNEARGTAVAGEISGLFCAVDVTDVGRDRLAARSTLSFAVLDRR